MHICDRDVRTASRFCNLINAVLVIIARPVLRTAPPRKHWRKHAEHIDAALSVRFSERTAGLR